jgi:adenine-specific DNA-methyltransferase
MPTLHWIGKDKVINHHRDVPYKVLEHAYGFDAAKGKTKQPTGSGNKVIHGDNLEALKSLLPEYEGKVKCIYIDPPYNTGNEGWVYNDNVNDPRIKKWLGDVVGKEGEDLSRHDKWLCMMYPRLVLLHKLLSEDGLIFVSLDEVEIHHFRMMMEEIFGASNYLSTVTWEKRFTRSNNAKLFSTVTENILVFRRSGMVTQLREARTEKADSIYTNPDNDPRGPWTSVSYVNPVTKEKRKNLVYTVTAPDGRKIDHPTHAWKYDRDTHAYHVDQKMLWWGNAGDNAYPRLKKFKDSLDGMVPVDLWNYEETGTTDEGSKILAEIIGANKFDNPKPPRLIERCLGFINDSNAIILDSFAGSGTTAHAVLNLNKQDGGNRKFILIEMMDYAESITAERVKRVMQGYGEGNKKTEGTGGTLDYYTLGAPLFNGQEQLNEDVGVERIREYIWYSETRAALETPTTTAKGKAAKANPYYLGMHEHTAYYFVYEAKALTTLDHELLGTLPTKGERTVIYADNCLLPKKFLEQHGIVFKKIPRDISRF